MFVARSWLIASRYHGSRGHPLSIIGLNTPGRNRFLRINRKLPISVLCCISDHESSRWFVRQTLRNFPPVTASTMEHMLFRDLGLHTADSLRVRTLRRFIAFKR